MASSLFILDTDLDTDCDDVGAIAMAHALHRRGVIQLGAVVCSAPVPACGPCALLLNRHAGLPELPVGAYTIAAERRWPRFQAYDEGRQYACGVYGPAGLYNDILVREHFGSAPPVLPSALTVYRRLLAAAAAGSVTICAIGTLSALAELLDSGPDVESALPGPELVRRKVLRLVTMATGNYPAGHDVFNWLMDREGAARVLNHWPSEVVVSPAGGDVLTGAALTGACAAENPFRRAYEIHRGGPGRSRSSWDQVALLYAAGAGAGLYAETGGKGLHYDPDTGDHTWSDTVAAAPRRHVLPSPPAEAMARIIEPLMVEGAQAPA
jgi:inosine-uridine nucleoside N-ribohydrolase